MSRLLLVEDDEHLAEGMAFNLRNNGYEVEMVESGEDALETVEQRSFDVILLDVMLPGIDGFEVVRRLRESGNIRPVLIITAKNRADDTIAGLNAGADDYITKPFDLDELLARIRGALRRQAWTHGSPAPAEPESLAYGEWTIDFRKFVAMNGEGRADAYGHRVRHAQALCPEARRGDQPRDVSPRGLGAYRGARDADGG